LSTIAFLVLFPVIVAALLLIIRNDKARAGITVVSAIVIAAGSIYLAVQYLGKPTIFPAVSEGIAEAVSYTFLVIDILLGLYIMGKGIKHKKYLAVILALVQVCIVVVFEFTTAKNIPIANQLYIDNLSIIMALIIGIIGSFICVYAIGYMRDFQREHEDQRDRRHIFFAVMFAFLGAMFMLVFANSLMWLFTAWEVTTVCSFALIGYTQTEEATNNAFRQIVMNLLGGLAFAIALVCVANTLGSLELNILIREGSVGSTALLLPITLLGFAALTKMAQMPWHSWLLGAMVAPTPTSALLHSSTMVKAGCFLLIKLAPCMGNNIPGWMVSFVGAATFLICSCMAISQSNAKRVLAYSTISNLGLIGACAGVGTPEAVWAAIFLTIFHSCAKSLLFLCVGTAEHHIGSRNIEDMDLLFERMPTLARFMMLGILVMFIAPFGMLISKWAALQSFVDSGNLILVLLLAFGSGATFFFWAKWIGKLTAVAGNKEDIEGTVSKSEWVAIGVMAVLALGCSILFPIISSTMVVPYLTSVAQFAMFPITNMQAISSDNLWLVAIISIFVIAVIVGLPKYSPKQRHVNVYLAGASIDNQNRVFKNAFSEPQEATQRNWYMEGIFGEQKLDKVACWTGGLLSLAGIIVALVFGMVK
jgi:ech hydrogenase subunit A